MRLWPVVRSSLHGLAREPVVPPEAEVPLQNFEDAAPASFGNGYPLPRKRATRRSHTEFDCSREGAIERCSSCDRILDENNRALDLDWLCLWCADAHAMAEDATWD